ncbi:MAG: methyl-accepting chemotaxis protein [Pseudomonadota bacterium]
MALFSNLTVRTRIGGGFAMVAAVAAGLAIFAYLTLSTLVTKIEGADDMSGDALLASELNADMGYLLLNANRYVRTRADGDLAAMRDFVMQMKTGLAIAQDEIRKPERVSFLDDINREFTAFETGLERIIVLYAERDDLVQNRIDSIGTEARKGLTFINESATRDGDFKAANFTAQIQQDFLLSRVYLRKFLGTNDAADVERALNELGKVASELDELDQSLVSTELKERLKETRALVEDYAGVTERIRDLIAERNTIRTETLERAGRDISTWAAAIKESAIRDQQAISTAAIMAAGNSKQLATIVSAIAFVVSVALGLLISASITRPISRLVADAEALAAGDTDAEFRDAARKDEIGTVAKSIAGFRDNVIERVRLEDSAAKELDRERHRQASLQTMVDEFRTIMTAEVSAVSEQMTSMRESASSVTSVAADAAEMAEVAKKGAGNTSTSVSSVAAATEEMTITIREISRQTETVNETVNVTANAADQTNEQVRSLSETAGQIGSVIGLIRDIAEQTNLLALNATIEAARAGDAGRGFAVVASEVKQLAEQTAKATDEIANNISGIQASVGTAADSIGHITGQVSDIRTSIETVSASVQEQQSSTQEISDSIQVASSGADDAIKNVGKLNEAISRTADEATIVARTVESVLEANERMTEQVEVFLKMIGEDVVERREALRVQSKEVVIIDPSGERITKRLSDISQTGAFISKYFDRQAGETIRLDLGFGEERDARVVRVTSLGMGVQFDHPLQADFPLLIGQVAAA